ncbi:sugar transferase [Sporosarcina luteola]|uniref:sugar transferase n=1 Tax=Sporosarcina luteola TaxID=582850 RepID=UPI002041E584|nr:sugar transferase [Sporosarcina luteola]MCM3711643.1 sugar transferase [Sporosarcina luteola]
MEVNKYQIIKRTSDIIVSSMLICCCIPVYLIISFWVAISSGRPVLFKQIRTGKGFRQFTIYKFRSMEQTSHLSDRHAYCWKEGVPDHFMFKTDFDETVTTVGKVLRKYSLDELPQLFNVLIGNMSIVGPRPEIPQITKHYSLYQSKRLMVKPGMTGYAQINGRSEISHGKKIEFDIYYVENQSFLLDIKIILSTIVLVVKGRGAF